MLAAALVAFVLATEPAAAAPNVLSPRVAALIAPVHQAYVDVAVAQSQSPPATDDRTRLERLLPLDQAGRQALEQIDLGTLPDAERKAAMAVIWGEISAHDVENEVELKKMIPPSGWFLPGAWGQDAAEAAFHIVQHAAGDPDLMRDTLKRIEPLARAGKYSGRDFAKMYDRVALDLDHKPQRYGTQFLCTAGKWEVPKLEDPANVDTRRRAIGMTETFADNMKRIESEPCW